jgi:hypothetical protein
MAKKSKTPTWKAPMDFMDSMIFSSCRYYIGRHTIAAHCAAGELGAFLRENPDCLSPDRRRFLAKDIRDQINNVLQFSSNVQVNGFAEYGHPDALVLLTRKMVELMKEHNLVLGTDDFKNDLVPGELNPSKYKWEIDLYNGVVEFEEWKNRTEGNQFPINYRELVSDLSVWSQLAGWLDPYLTVSATNPDGQQITEVEGFEFPSTGRYVFEDFEHVHLNIVDCGTYANRTVGESYIAPEFITEVKYHNS